MVKVRDLYEQPIFSTVTILSLGDRRKLMDNSRFPIIAILFFLVTGRKIRNILL